MLDRYIMYIFIGAKVNHTSSKYAVIHCPIFYQVPSLKSARCPSPLFRQFPSIYCFFFATTLPANLHNIRIFHL